MQNLNNSMKILTTGSQSGIGKYIYETIGGTAITRTTPAEDFESLKREGVDVIIHCAFNSAKKVSSANLYNYLYDNVILTNELVNIPHGKFIFFSTVDLYPKNDELHKEDEEIDMNMPRRIYETTKLLSEAIVKEKSSNYLILRPTTMVGRYSRKNTLVRIVQDEGRNLFLSGRSMFNYVLHSDIVDFIRFAIDNNVKGIFNVASNSNIILSDVADLLNKRVQFGNHLYKVGNISNDKISSIFPAFNKTSEEVLKQFIEGLKDE